MSNFYRMSVGFFAALMLALAAGCTSPPKHQPQPQHERVGEYVDDSVVTARVKAALFNEPNLKSAEINVETFKGVVQLSGFVSSAAAQSRAVEIARGIDGVKSVKDDMRLK